MCFHSSEDKDSDGKEKKSKSKEKDKKKEPASMFQINGEKESKSKKKGDNIFDKLLQLCSLPFSLLRNKPQLNHLDAKMIMKNHH